MLRYHLSKAPDPEGALAQRLRRVPTGVALTPRNIATTALYLCSGDSAGVTGTSIVIDGGYLAAAESETCTARRKYVIHYVSRLHDHDGR